MQSRTGHDIDHIATRLGTAIRVVKALAATAAHVTGIDLTPAMIARATEHTRDCSNVSFVTGDVQALPYPDGHFSLVVARFAFHHFVQPAAVLAEMHRVCKPDGRVLVCDLLASDDASKAQAFHELEMLRDPSHARALTLAELKALFDGAGLARRADCAHAPAFRLGKHFGALVSAGP